MKLPCSARFVFTLLSQFVKIVLSWAVYVWGILGLGRSRSPFSSHTLDFYSNDLVLSQFVKIIYIWVVVDLGCAPKTFPIPIKIRNVPGFFSLAILWSKSMTMVWNGILGKVHYRSLQKISRRAISKLIEHQWQISGSFSVRCALPWSTLAAHKLIT